MKTFIIGVLLGIIIGAGALWVLQQRQAGTLVSTQQQTVAEAKRLVDAKLDALKLQAGTIQKELAETGRVVRRSASALGEQVADATADARITTTIKAKLVADPELSALAISVSTTDGTVTLSGKVASPELVGKAMLVALQTDGVREVVSVLQVAKE
jgi:hypothetical protein